MAQSAEELRRDIEQTRADMTRDVDAISEKVSPGRIVHRRVDRAKSAAGSLRERVMGSASSAAGSMGDGAGSVQSSVSDAVTGAPDAALSRTQGNPLAAGLIAFSAGYLLAGLFPASKVEERAAQSLEDTVKEPLKEHLSGFATEMKDDLQESAQQAVQSVKETATEAADTIKEQGQQSAQAVQSDAKDATDEVRNSTTSHS